MTAATSADVRKASGNILQVLVMGALAFLPGPCLQAEPDLLRHATSERYFTVHSLALSDSGRPHALISSAPDRFATGPYTLSVVSSDGAQSKTRVTELRALARMGPLAELAVDAAGVYALAISDERGLLFSLHDSKGTKLHELAPLPDQVPIALFAASRGFLLVSNRGHYLIDGSGKVAFEETAPSGTYIAAAVELPAHDCSFASILVHPAERKWVLRQHCLEETGFKLRSSVEGPAAAAASHPLRLAANARQVLITASSATERGKWVAVQCLLGDSVSCVASPLHNVPGNPIIVVKGLAAFMPTSSTAVILAPSEGGDALWLASLRGSKEGPTPSRMISLPGLPKESTAILESMALRQSGESVWLAVAYSDWDPPSAAGVSAPQQRSSVRQ